MPWCDPCQKYWAPSSVKEDGTCPRCGTDLDPPAAAHSDGDDEEATPWHFKLMVVALVVYLVWRFGTMLLG
jgi:hypothetical protein